MLSDPIYACYITECGLFNQSNTLLWTCLRLAAALVVYKIIMPMLNFFIWAGD